MTFKCPYTEQCRAEALREFAAMPELAALFQTRVQCAERDPQRAQRCAMQLGLTEATLPTFGAYVQERRRAQNLPQAKVAQQLGIDLQTLRDIELDKLAPQQLPRQIIDRIASALSASGEYLAALAHISAVSESPHQRSAFARTTPPSEDSQESRS